MPALRICKVCGALAPKHEICPQGCAESPHSSYDYRKARQQRMQIAQGRCEVAGCTTPTDRLQSHHSNGNRYDHRVSNLIVLCHHHHLARHNQGLVNPRRPTEALTAGEHPDAASVPHQPRVDTGARAMRLS